MQLQSQHVTTPLPRVVSESHEEWLIDQAGAESFPASDPPSIAQPAYREKSPD